MAAKLVEVTAADMAGVPTSKGLIAFGASVKLSPAEIETRNIITPGALIPAKPKES